VLPKNCGRGILYLVMMSALALSARAGSIIYSFTYTPTSGPFPSATFQLPEPGFLGAGTYSITSSSFSPFTISDGSVTYGFTELFVAPFGSDFCFVFGDNQNSFGGCGASLSASGAPVAMISTEYAGSIPTSSGSFAGSAIVDAYPPFATGLEQGIGTMQFTIVQTPEPATAPLVGTSLLSGVTLIILRRGRRLELLSKGT